MHGIESNIHLVWLGSKLKQIHVDRIGEWKKLNPQFAVTVWVESLYESEVKEQLLDKEVSVRLVTELSLSEHLKTLLTNLSQVATKYTYPNYAATTDGYRFKVLHDFGGWYFDTDITPIELSSIVLNPQFNFYFNAERRGNRVSFLSPSVIAAKSKSRLTVNALIGLEEMGRLLTQIDYNAIRSRKASIRFLATMASTGAVLRSAIASIKHNNLPLIEMLNTDDGKINHITIFDTLATRFTSAMEQSWILREVVRDEDNPEFHTVTSIPGIELDANYEQAMTGFCIFMIPVPRSIALSHKLAFEKIVSGQDNLSIEPAQPSVGTNLYSFHYSHQNEVKVTQDAADNNNRPV